MLAPWSIGRQVIGAVVLSMMSGMPSSLPIAAISAIGNSSSFGFGSVSPKKARVFSSASLRKLSGSDGSANRTSIPSRAKVLVKRFHVPPYRWGDDTILSPVAQRFWIEMATAEDPDDTANAAIPPSRAASRSSSTAVVGFIIRV